MSVVMNLFSATSKVIILCGRHKIHFYELKKDQKVASDIITLDVTNLLSDSEKLNREKISVVCCGISLCSNYAIVADSEKNVFMYLRNNGNWKHHCTWKMEKRIIKAQFNKSSTAIILTDKTGDVSVCFFDNMTVSSATKILGHCSLISDTIVSDDNTQIYTCDRDEKIRVSLFPDAFEITNFLLGHREAVVNMAFAKQDSLIVSAACDGIVKVWNRVDGQCSATWNIFEIIPGSETVKPQDFELIRMRATDNTLVIGYLAILLRKYPDIHIFKIDFETLKISHYGQVKKTSDFCDATWVNQNLYVFTPETATVEKYICNETELVPDSQFKCLENNSEAETDIIDYAAFHKDFVSLKKLAWVDKSKPVDYDSNKYGMSKLSRLQSLELDSSANSSRTEKDVT